MMSTKVPSKKQIKSILKQAFVKSRLLTDCAIKLTRDYPKIFMYHRFCASGNSVWGGISQDEFEWQIAKVVKSFEVISFGDFLQRKSWQVSTKNCAVITIDDGYRDFYLYAYPVLKKAGVPATLFVTSDFIHQRIWLWPDKLKYIVQTLKPGRYSYTFGDNHFDIDTLDDAHSLVSWLELSNICTKLPLEERELLIRHLSTAMAIKVPDIPGAEFAACRWEELREMQASGIEIGSHTLTHPVLSRIPQAEMIQEVRESKDEIERMLGCRISTFCYPSGGMLDINENVVKAVADAGYSGAAHGNPPRDWNPFLVPRMGADDDRLEFIWRMCGMEYLVARVNGLFDGMITGAK
ncbi:MAG: polysaccharide deacetylase family protein [Desulfuromonadaceae bacterium]|nr:polysaccharide deacetylase family protein [Desulfuromonadaceae bacterium]